jgi:hypothetical protein
MDMLQQMRLAKFLRQKAQHAPMAERHRLLSTAAVLETLARARARDPSRSVAARWPRVAAHRADQHLNPCGKG